MNKVCLNPKCGKVFEPGHYGDRQIVCGKKDCQKWYKKHWASAGAVPRGIPKDIFNKILRVVKDHPAKKALFQVARYTGMREGEILGLCWKDVLDEDGNIKSHTKLRRQWNIKKRAFTLPKSQKPRDVFFLKEAQQALKVFKGKRKVKGDDRVFPFAGSTIYKWWIRAQDQVGVENPNTGYPYRFHDLRHALATELVTSGRMDLAKRILGHAHLSTTERYAHKSADDVIDEISELRS